MTKKQLLRCIAFLLLAACMLPMLCILFEQTHGTNVDSTFYTYRELESDTIDAVFFGTSGVTCYWLAGQAYQDYGMTVYPLASEAMPSWLYEIAMDEALEYQNPELFIIDIRPFTSPDYEFSKLDYRVRKFMDALKPLSRNLFRSAFRTMKELYTITEGAPKLDISYVFNFIKYHSSWSDPEYSFSHHLGAHGHENYTGGFNMDTIRVVNRVPIAPHVYDDTITSELLPVHEKYLYEILDYVREKNLKVLFVDTPKTYMSVNELGEDFLDTEAIGRANRVFQILEEEGFDYLTYVTTAEDGSFTIDLDYNTDFFNAHHVNYYGAEKFTKAFSEYLDQNYDLPDRRNDPAAQAHWDGIYDYVLAEVKSYEEEAAELAAAAEMIEEIDEEFLGE